MTPKRTPTAPGPGPGDFTYDRARWEQRVPRIAVLAGPHKTASTTLQAFVAGIAAAGAAWEWPYAKDPPFRHLRPPKFYAPLAAIVSGHNVYIEKWAPAAEAHGNMTATEQVAWRAEVAGHYQSYYQHLFRGVLERGKNLVIGAEAFDLLVWDLQHGNVSDAGEDTHVARHSGRMIAKLLNVFPWDDGTTATASALRLEDIEVHVNYRTPRTTHLISLWHQVGGDQTFRTYLKGQPNGLDDSPLHMTNSLALALQFVRRGIKATLVDMAGVVEKEARETAANDANATVVGGLRGVVACDILRWGKSTGLCDDDSRLHLPRSREEQGDLNKKEDRNVLNLAEGQLQEIERAYEAYDCDVWQYLQTYQAKGLLRMLYPAAGRFAACRPGRSDTSFRTLVKRMHDIAAQDNGMPETP